MTTNPTDPRLKVYPENLLYQIKSFEKIPIDIFENAQSGSAHIANLISLAIRAKEQRGESLVLGLATGSTPLKVYKELIRMHKEDGLSFKNVITFNLDEYYPLDPGRRESYHYFMNEFLFNHIDIPKENINIPTGSLPLEDIGQFCKDYEKKIQLSGGIDIQLLGIGRTGHIGFNEPGSEKNSVTRLVRLDSITRRDAMDDFGGMENVPYEAVTMGVKSILDAREIYIMAWGQHKAEIVKTSVESVPHTAVPATFLQDHPRVRFYLDTAAASKLTRVETPWKAGSCSWDDDLICKAVVWLATKIKKPLLKITDDDYNENGLSELLLKGKSAYDLNLKIFNKLQHTITGWPGGKPDTDDKQRPERAMPTRKRVVIFSPHPDDDVISMGATFRRLVEQGHDVHVAYQTSGNIAVHDHDMERYLEFFEEFYNVAAGKDSDLDMLAQAKKALNRKNATATSIPIRKIKGLIRRGEARAGARSCGLEDHQIHHLDLPFYETGQVKKNGPTGKDIQLTMDFLNEIKPHQVFAAGDLADPHGTHRICLDIILASLQNLKKEKWIKDCWLWLYRGAWQEFQLDEIEMAVPISPKELLQKRNAIFMHQSQKDKPPFPGSDNREFWQRSEDRNRYTAQSYRDLGFAEYEAIEAFRRWHY